MLNSRKYTFVAQLDVFNSEMAGRVVTKIYRLGWTIEAAHVIARRLLRCVVGDTWLYLSPFSIYIAVWTCTGLSLNTGITSSFTKMGVGPMVRPALTFLGLERGEEAGIKPAYPGMGSFLLENFSKHYLCMLYYQSLLSPGLIALILLLNLHLFKCLL